MTRGRASPEHGDCQPNLSNFGLSRAETVRLEYPWASGVAGGACRLPQTSLLLLAERCPNLIGFKHSVACIEKFVAIRQTLGDLFAYLGGLPTDKLFTGAYLATGCLVNSPAV